MLRKSVIGFTIASAFILGCLLIFYFLYWPKFQEKNTAILALIVEEGLSEYHEEIGDYPTGTPSAVIAALLGNNPRDKAYLKSDFRAFLDSSGNAQDAWKQPFRFDKQASGSFILRSAGPDGTFNNADDLTSKDALD